MENIKYRRALDGISPYIFGKTADDVKKEYALDKVYRYMANENPYGASKYVKEAVIAALEEPSFYPDGKERELLSIIIEKYQVAANQVLFGNGTEEIIYLLSEAFAEKGKNIITADTTFFSYEASSTAMGAEVIRVPLKNHRFDLETIAESINDDTGIIFLCNPNNPTGTIYTEEEQRKFLKKVPSHIPVVLDEAYGEYVSEKGFPDSFKMLKEYKNIIILKTFSKIYGLASLRIGYALTSPQIIELLHKVKTVFNVNGAAYAAATAAIKDSGFISMVKKSNLESLKYLYEAFEEMGISYIPTQTSFLMADLDKDAVETASELMKSGYLVRPMPGFNSKNTYVRISVGKPEDMKGFTETLKNVLRR